MEIGVYGPTSAHINIKGSMGQKYPYSTRWEQNIVAILHIYGARKFFRLFCYHQDTEFIEIFPPNIELDGRTVDRK